MRGISAAMKLAVVYLTPFCVASDRAKEHAAQMFNSLVTWASLCAGVPPAAGAQGLAAD